MRINTLQQLDDLCDNIYIAHTKVQINKFLKTTTHNIYININEFTNLSHNDYIMKVLYSAFKVHNCLEITLGASNGMFTIGLHMSILYY